MDRLLVRYEHWEWGEFGRCPACGSVGVEIWPCMDCESVDFRCSRERCWTNYPYADMLTLTGVENLHLRTHSPTGWVERKPKWWKRYEIEEMEPYWWNWKRFSQTWRLNHDWV